MVGNLPITMTQAELQALFDTAPSPYAPTSCEIKQNSDGLSWGFAVLEFAESAEAWEVVDAMVSTTIGEPARDLRIVKLYAKDKPKPKPKPEPKPEEPKPKAPDPEASKNKMALMRKLKAAGHVAGTMSRVKSLSKAKIADPKMSLNNRLSALEEEVAKWAAR